MTDTTDQAPPAAAPPSAEDDEIVVPPRSASRVEEGDGSTRAVLLDLERERKARQKLERDLKKMQEATQSESEKALAAARAEGRTEALSVSNARILRAEVKAAAGLSISAPLIHRLEVPSMKYLSGAAMLPKRVGLPRARPAQPRRSSRVA